MLFWIYVVLDLDIQMFSDTSKAPVQMCKYSCSTQYVIQSGLKWKTLRLRLELSDFYFLNMFKIKQKVPQDSAAYPRKLEAPANIWRYLGDSSWSRLPTCHQQSQLGEIQHCLQISDPPLPIAVLLLVTFKRDRLSQKIWISMMQMEHDESLQGNIKAVVIAQRWVTFSKAGAELLIWEIINS